MTDLATETATLLGRDADFAAAASSGSDVDEVLSFWTADAVVVPPGQPPIVGHAALRQYVQDSYQIPGFSITWEATADPEFSPDRRMAYLWGRNAVSYADPEGAVVRVRGRALTIWRREDNGEWRCAVDMWQDEPDA